MTDILGVDISHWQSVVNWDKMVEQSIRFAFLKCSEGATYQDVSFERNYRAAKSRGILVGAYHFVRMNIKPADQLANIARAIGDARLDFFALDCETTDGQTSLICTSTIRTLASKTAGINGAKAPFIYTSQGWWDTNVRRMSIWKQYPLWVASWNTQQPSMPKDWNTWVVWQYTNPVAGETYGVPSLLEVDKWNPAVAFPGAAEPEQPGVTVTGTITINGVDYQLIKKE